MMPVVNVRELARNTSRVIGGVARTKRATLVMKAGRPVAAVVPVDPDALEDWILANAPEFVRGMRLAEQEWRQGKTVSLEDFMATMPESRPRRRAAKTKRPKRRPSA